MCIQSWQVGFMGTLKSIHLRMSFEEFSTLWFCLSTLLYCIDLLFFNQPCNQVPAHQF